ncbi:MAG: GntR family transcriptional regulator [Hyphomicrobiales bacterium]|nr:MAG: GntR family transcriptional regulator [Hyphomicrobiales bacterium]
MSLGDSLSPVSNNFTLKGHIYDVLREAILAMDIYDEDADLRLDERGIAEKLGISRTPVRDAFAKLEQEGFVEIQPRKGIFIVRKSLNEVLGMIVVWAALESMAARLATERATDDDFKSLRKFAMEHSKHAARAELEEYSDANIKFHQQILDLAQCSLLRTTADGLFQHMHAVRRRAMGENDRAARSVVDHMEIIEALESRDADLAGKLVRDHTMRLHDHVRRRWSKLEYVTQMKTMVG